MGQSFAEPLKLPEREDDGVVGGADRMKEITRDHHGVGSRGNDAVNAGGTPGDVGFSLVDAAEVCRWYCRMPRWGSAMWASFTGGE